MSSELKFNVTKVDLLPTPGFGLLYHKIIKHVLAKKENGVFKVEVADRTGNSLASGLARWVSKNDIKHVSVRCRAEGAYVIVEE